MNTEISDSLFGSLIIIKIIPKMISTVIAFAGVLNLGLSFAINLANGSCPRSAIDIGIRGNVKIFPFKQPKIETIIPILIIFPPYSPSSIPAAVAVAFSPSSTICVAGNTFNNAKLINT
ncbi:Uncharacterised protein [Streptococcus pneumoniae]|nr:Uncharacterised protein [Streptococcus pneumoniae]